MVFPFTPKRAEKINILIYIEVLVEMQQVETVLTVKKLVFFFNIQLDRHCFVVSQCNSVHILKTIFFQVLFFRKR